MSNMEMSEIISRDSQRRIKHELAIVRRKVNTNRVLFILGIIFLFGSMPMGFIMQNGIVSSAIFCSGIALMIIRHFTNKKINDVIRKSGKNIDEIFKVEYDNIFYDFFNKFKEKINSINPKLIDYLYNNHNKPINYLFQGILLIKNDKVLTFKGTMKLYYPYFEKMYGDLLNDAAFIDKMIDEILSKKLRNAYRDYSILPTKDKLDNDIINKPLNQYIDYIFVDFENDKNYVYRGLDLTTDMFISFNEMFKIDFDNILQERIKLRCEEFNKVVSKNIEKKKMREDIIKQYSLEKPNKVVSENIEKKKTNNILNKGYSLENNKSLSHPKCVVVGVNYSRSTKCYYYLSKISCRVGDYVFVDGSQGEESVRVVFVKEYQANENLPYSYYSMKYIKKIDYSHRSY